MRSAEQRRNEEKQLMEMTVYDEKYILNDSRDYKTTIKKLQTILKTKNKSLKLAEQDMQDREEVYGIFIRLGV